MAITKITGDVVDTGSVGSALSAVYSLRVSDASGTTRLELISFDGTTTTVVSTIDMTELYATLGEVGRT